MTKKAFHNQIVRLVYILLFTLFGITALYSQKEQAGFTILDEKSRDPIQFCYVVIKGKNISTQTDENGKVEIQASNKDTLVIYQLGYFLKKVTINDITKNQNIVFLKSKNITLEEVVVKSSVIDTFQNNNNNVFIDFDFYDDLILSIINKGKTYNSLQLLENNGKKVCEIPLKIKAELLFKDCFENIHLITKDSVYQIYYNYQTISLLKPYHISKFYAFLQPCECFHGTKYIFKVRHYKALKNTYCLYDEKTVNNNQVIACIADSSAIKGFNMDYDINYFLTQRRKGAGYFTSVSEINKHIDQYREELTLPSDYANLLRPVESEIKKLDTNFVLFDYTNKLAYFLSLNGQLQYKTKLNDFSEISPKLYIDYDAHNFIFTTVDKNGILTLFQYDKLANKFTHKFVLKNFYFIKNFKIKGNNIYFINKDKFSNNSKTKIVKMSINWQAL